MKKVYTNQNIALVGAARSYLKEHSISGQMRNEYSSSVMGEVAFFDVWPELWVSDDEAEFAIKLLLDLQQVNTDGPEWVCANCRETNPANFASCWQCSNSY